MLLKVVVMIANNMGLQRNIMQTRLTLKNLKHGHLDDSLKYCRNMYNKIIDNKDYIQCLSTQNTLI
jgi:hypothetical protein